jgi:predicted DNA-binding transcriptional regulator AlpA
MDTREAARHLGICYGTLLNWRVQGSGPSFLRIGRAVRYSEADLEEWTRTRRFASTSAADKGLHER